MINEAALRGLSAEELVTRHARGVRLGAVSPTVMSALTRELRDRGVPLCPTCDAPAGGAHQPTCPEVTPCG